MGYYKGDFYGSGGYYRGDPGFFSFLGRVGKMALGAATGIQLPTRAVVKGVETPTIGEKGLAVSKAIASKAVGIVKGHPVMSAAGAAGVIGAGVGTMAGRKMGRAGMVPAGMLLHRKHRRMNPCNPRALRRAIRRAHAFERLAKHVIGFSSPRKPKGHMYFKKRRRK